MQLRGKYSLIILAITLFSLTALALSLGLLFSQASEKLLQVNERTIQGEFLAQMDTNSEFIAEQLAQNMALPLFNYDYDMLEVLADVTLADDDIVSVRIFDLTNNFEQEQEFPQELKLDLDSVDDEILAKLNRRNSILIDNDQSFSHLVPIVVFEQVIGGVEITFSRIGVHQDILLMREYANEQNRKNLFQFLQVAGTVTAIILLFVISVVYLASTWLVTPIQKMARFANQIGKGEMARLEPTHGSDELGDLARSMTDMASNLKLRSYEIEHLAYHDYLTDLPNRVMFIQSLDNWLDHFMVDGGQFALLQIDLNKFKRVNDLHGHQAGDQVLIQLSSRLCQVLDNDQDRNGYKRKMPYVLARLASDQFALLIQVTDRTDCQEVAELLIDDFERPYLIQEYSLYISAAIGITLYPDDTTDATQLIRNTEITVQNSKASDITDRRKMYNFFSAELAQQISERSKLEDDLKQALEEKQLQVWYQPIFRMSDQSLCGAEALVRWQHPERGFVSPASFIPLAEETGQMIPLGQEILEQICSQLATWKKLIDPDFHVAINISAMQLRQKDLAKRIIEQIKIHDVPLRHLHIEITETALVQQEVLVNDTLTSLSDLNIPIWLDDFGTGYSSLSHLKDFPVSGVKIDRSFVSDLEKNDDDRDLVIAVIELAKRLNLELVAEGIETAAQFEMLAELGCHNGQGYYMGRPIPADEFSSMFLKDSSS